VTLAILAGVNVTLSPRARRVGDAAIGVLADQGARGLTHRAVDRAAGLPPGTTSNHARTRVALLTLALTRIAELDAAEAGGPDEGGPDEGGAGPAGAGTARVGLARVLAGALNRMITVPEVRRRTVARFELALEARRRPELRAAYDEMGGGFRDSAAALLGQAGSAQPERDAWILVAWLEGIAFYALAGAGTTTPPALEQLTAELSRLLAGMCGDDDSGA
jgi:Tetracyclin repressor-like, C-terminal domain